MIIRITIPVFILIMLLFTGCSTKEEAETTLTIMAGSSLTEVLAEVQGAFEEKNRHIRLRINFDGSQWLVHQLREGVQADLFLSPSPEYVDHIEAQGMVVSRKVFAFNTLVLGVARGRGLRSFEDLVQPGIKLAMADPSVPLGAYTMEVLKKVSQNSHREKSYEDSFLENVVSKELSAKGVVSKLALGEVDGGILFSTDIHTGNLDSVEGLYIPEDINLKVPYTAALLTTTQSIDEARSFLDFLSSREAVNLLERYGYLTESGEKDG